MLNRNENRQKAVCADGGYDNCEIYNSMMERKIKTFIPRRDKPISNASYDEEFQPENFIYDEESDTYICPMGCTLNYCGYLKSKGYLRYSAKYSECKNCPVRSRCIGNANHGRRIERHMHEKARQYQIKNLDTSEYYRAMRLRKVWCEGNFSHQKERHNLRRTLKRGIEKITEQGLLSACALNLKRLVKAM